MKSTKTQTKTGSRAGTTELPLDRKAVKKIVRKATRKAIRKSIRQSAMKGPKTARKAVAWIREHGRLLRKRGPWEAYHVSGGAGHSGWIKIVHLERHEIGDPDWPGCTHFSPLSSALPEPESEGKAHRDPDRLAARLGIGKKVARLISCATHNQDWGGPGHRRVRKELARQLLTPAQIRGFDL